MLQQGRVDGSQQPAAKRTPLYGLHPTSCVPVGAIQRGVQLSRGPIDLPQGFPQRIGVVGSRDGQLRQFYTGLDQRKGRTYDGWLISTGAQRLRLCRQFFNLRTPIFRRFPFGISLGLGRLWSKRFDNPVVLLRR